MPNLGQTLMDLLAAVITVVVFLFVVGITDWQQNSPLWVLGYIGVFLVVFVLYLKGRT